MSDKLGRDYNRIVIIPHHLRLARAYNVWRKLYRVTHDSWPALFGTKEHKRRVIRLEKAAARFNRLVEREFGLENCHWRVKDIKTVGISILWRVEEEENTDE